MEDDGLTETLHRVLKNFEKVMSFANMRNIIEHNPIVEMAEDFGVEPRNHHPTIPPEKLPEFLKDLQKADQKYQTKLLLKFQLLTILRCKEVCSLEWIDVDWEKCLLSIPAEKMKGGKRGHIVALSTQALSILEEMKQFTGHRRFIFMSRVNKETHVNKETPNKAIGRIANGKYKGRLVAHGLRSASTFLHDVYTTEYYVVEACLSHRDKSSVANAYNRGTYLDRRRVLMQTWGDFVSQCEQA